MKIENKRQLFVLMWSFLSVLGILFQIYYVPSSSLAAIVLYYMTGFHVPQDAIYYCVLFGLFTDYPEIGVVFLSFGIAFLVPWVISLVKMKQTRMFEFLILSDRLISLLMFTVVVIIQRNDFNGWYLFLFHIFDLIIAFWLCKMGKKRVLRERSSLV